MTLNCRILAAVAWLVGALAASADEPREAGMFVKVPTPITSTVVNQLKETIARAEASRGVKKVVFDFNAGGKEAVSQDFGPCVDLATFIRQKRSEGKVLTVAFVRNRVARHAVLPVLACEDLVMAPEAVLGPVAIDAKSTPAALEVAAYKQFASPDQEALVLKMLDARIDVFEGRKGKAVWYVDGAKEAEAVKDGIAIVVRKPVLPAGVLAQFGATEARKYDLAKAVLVSRQQVEERYNLPPGTFRENPLQDRSPIVWRVIVQGEVTGGLESSLKRRLDRIARQGGNLIIVQIECSGGSMTTARDIAEHLRGLTGPDGSPVMTVAFVPRDAPDTAFFLALGCTEIVLSEKSRLGDFTGMLSPPPPPKRGPPPVHTDPTVVAESLEQLAESQGYSPLLIRGLFQPDIEIVRAKRATGAVQEKRFLTPADAAEKDADGQSIWVIEDTVKHVGKPLIVNGENARSLGLARYIVAKPDDINEVYRWYSVDPGEVRDAGSDWLDRIASFFADPFVSAFLLLVGFACLFLELKLPGSSLPGIIAAVCFVTFFWSHSQLNGQVAMLAAMLFLLGLVLLGIEMFLIPGFGVIGFAGVALIVIGLGLASAEKMPQSSTEWSALSGSVLRVGAILTGGVVLAFSLARYLPYIPVANRLVLIPPDEQPDAEPATVAPDYSSLLGAIGSAATMLRPAGMARFGDRFVDVVSEGDFVPAGTTVQVVEIEGARVVVKEV